VTPFSFQAHAQLAFGVDNFVALGPIPPYADITRCLISHSSDNSQTIHVVPALTFDRASSLDGIRDGQQLVRSNISGTIGIPTLALAQNRGAQALLELLHIARTIGSSRYLSFWLSLVAGLGVAQVTLAATCTPRYPARPLWSRVCA
jgi:hypothetical protein